MIWLNFEDKHFFVRRKEVKNILLIAIALCFVFLSSFENPAQTKQSAVNQKLVKCRVNGKVVYRTRCQPKKKVKQEVSAETNTPVTDQSDKIISGGTGQGTGLGNGRGTGQGTGSGLGNGSGSGNTEKKETAVPDSKVKPKPTNVTRTVVILSKPRAEYTDIAKKNQVQGSVSVRVTFLAEGTIGDVSLVSGLPDGLSEQAAAAAKQIRFQPAMKNGVPFTTTRIVQYNFTLY